MSADSLTGNRTQPATHRNTADDERGPSGTALGGSVPYDHISEGPALDARKLWPSARVDPSPVGQR